MGGKKVTPPTNLGSVMSQIAKKFPNVFQFFSKQINLFGVIDPNQFLEQKFENNFGSSFSSIGVLVFK
jgi:hypothetical protein